VTNVRAARVRMVKVVVVVLVVSFGRNATQTLWSQQVKDCFLLPYNVVQCLGGRYFYHLTFYIFSTNLK